MARRRSMKKLPGIGHGTSTPISSPQTMPMGSRGKRKGRRSGRRR